MKKLLLENGVRLLYKFREGEHTSFSIALDAGANKEKKYNVGVAHALEHMLFKGTKNFTENEINNKLDEIFGFNNAMTNFPYAIYYGTTANDDFKEGFTLYSDIILNPILNTNGFTEELNVIMQESVEWKEELEQYCEDLLLSNAFKNERISEIIIGEKDNVERLNIGSIKDFYNNMYLPDNIVVSVITSLDYEYIRNIVNNLFRNISGNINKEKLHNREFSCGIFEEKIEGNNSCKITYGFNIDNLSLKEKTALKLFNLWFGEGVSSILYDEVRTKAGLAYEVYSTVKGEKGIDLFKIAISTSKENKETVLSIVDKCIKKAMELDKYLTEKDIKKISKRFKLKTSLELERSIVLANRTAIFEVMYDDYNHVFNELNMCFEYSIEEIKAIVNKVLKDKAIQILI